MDDIVEVSQSSVSPSSPSSSWLCNPNKAYYRFVVLFFNCLLTFGSYFCFDMPSVLQDDFTGTYGINCTFDKDTNKTICVEHLGLTETQYNLLYTVYAWMNAAVVVGSGVLIDKLGHRVGALLFSTLCVVGSTIFAAGYFFKGTKSMFVLFLVGRLLFGAGNGSLTIAQNKISAFWFEGKELAFAFGVTLAFSRLGSVINFLLTGDFVKAHGLKWTLWGGAMLCGTGAMSAIILFFLDKLGTARLVHEEEEMTGKKEKRKMRFGDIRHLSVQFWLLVITTMFFYNTVFPFVADASQFIQETYHFSEKKSAYIAGSVYDISLILTPLLGLSVDYVGYRGILATSCAFFTIPVFFILAFTSLHPLVGTLLLGLTYSAAAGSLWPSVPLVVNPGVLGTALGLMTSVQMIGIGLCNLVVGSILDTKSVHKWKYVMIFLFGNSIVCVIASICLNIVDWRREGILNKTKKKMKKKVILIGQDTDPLIDNDNSVNA